MISPNFRLLYEIAARGRKRGKREGLIPSPKIAPFVGERGRELRRERAAIPLTRNSGFDHVVGLPERKGGRVSNGE